MKRPQPKDARPGRRVQDIKKAYTQEQLAEIGAIALKWNGIDFFVDFLLLIAIKPPVDLWLQVTKRINGMDGKLEILRLYANRSNILTGEAQACTKSSLDQVSLIMTGAP